MQEFWAGGKDAMPGVPDGLYTLQLQEAVLKESESSGKLMITRTHLVLDGDYQGETIKDFLSLETEKGPYFVAQWVEQMGYEVPDNVEQLEDVILAISGANPVYTGNVKRSGDFTNVRVKELLETVEEPATPTTPQAPKPTAPKAVTKPAVKAQAHMGYGVGDSVSFTDGEGNAIGGTITAFEGAEAHVQDAGGAVWAVPLADLKPSSPQAEEPAPEANPNADALFAFAQAYGLEVKDGDDVAESLKGYQWEEEKLMPEEIALLTANGIPTLAKPKPAPVAKAIPKAAPLVKRKK
jgi:hypothetical protein